MMNTVLCENMINNSVIVFESKATWIFIQDNED